MEKRWQIQHIRESRRVSVIGMRLVSTAPGLDVITELSLIHTHYSDVRESSSMIKSVPGMFKAVIPDKWVSVDIKCSGKCVRRVK